METVRNVLNVAVVCLEVVLLFNLLIVVHELGHFLAARWRGLVVEKFGIWFGRPLWKKTINGVQYSLGTIPFGGFVALPQMAPMDAVEGASELDRESLPAVSPLDKIIVAFAGPLFSFLLAVFFACLVYVVGRPVSEEETSRVIGYVLPDSPAAKAKSSAADVPPGLRPGDKILKVDGHPVTRFGGMTDSVVWYVVRSEGESIPFEVLRDGRDLTFYPTPVPPTGESNWRRKSLRQVLIEPSYRGMVASVEPGSPAQRAGLQPNDIITGLNGKTLLNPLALLDTELDSYGQPLELTVERNHHSLNLTLPPIPLRVGDVLEGSPAERAGLKKGDDIAAINGVAPTKFTDLKAAILAHPTAPIDLSVARNGAVTQMQVVPQTPSARDEAQTPGEKLDPMIGIERAFDADGIVWDKSGVMDVVYEKPLAQIKDGVMTVFNTVGALFAPKSGIKLQHLGGPLFIFRMYYLLFQSDQGWRLALAFSVVLNVNLALLNMLPIPVLDGGHILLALIETVRRKPVNIRLLEVIQTACFVVIAGYMLYVSFYDVGDLTARKSRPELRFASPAPTH